MHDPQRKNKMISFRISNEEYDALKGLYHHQGARNLSEFARTAMLHLLAEPLPRAGSVEVTLQSLAGQVAAVRNELGRLVQVMTGDLSPLEGTNLGRQSEVQAGAGRDDSSAPTAAAVAAAHGASAGVHADALPHPEGPRPQPELTTAAPLWEAAHGR
jgi:hypothetical protein